MSAEARARYQRIRNRSQQKGLQQETSYERVLMCSGCVAGSPSIARVYKRGAASAMGTAAWLVRALAIVLLVVAATDGSIVIYRNL